MAINFEFDNPLAAFNDGYAGVQRLRTDIGKRQAGQALAAGDYGRAGDILGSYGDLTGVRQVRADQQAQTDRTKAATKEKLEAAARLAKSWLTLPDDQIPAAYEQSVPLQRQLGFSEEDIEQGRRSLDKATLRQIVTAAGQELQKFTVGGSSESGYFAYDPTNPLGSMQQMTPPGPRKPNWQEMKRADGSSYYVDMNAFAPGQGGVATLAGPSGTPAPSASPVPGGGGFAAVIGPLFKREGGFVAQDGRSGAPANFGINQRANPDIDVRNLTPERAAQIYKERYWDKINGDSLPPEAQPAVMDAAVNQGPQRALQWWQQSGGDLNRFNELRLAHYRSLPDYQQNKASWERRVQETGGGQPTPSAGLPPGAIPGSEAPRPEWVDESDGSQRNVRTGERRDRPASLITAEQKRQERNEKLADARAVQADKARSIISTIDAVLPQIGWGEAGWLGATSAKIPGTKAYNVAKQIETITANLSFQELAEMRKNSPTGGALGGIAVRELELLGATVANLDIGQSEQQLEDNLKKIRKHYNNWLEAVNKAGSEGGAEAIRVSTPDEARALPPGTVFVTPDGRRKVR